MNVQNNLSVQKGLVSYEDRRGKYGQPGIVVWMTGLSGSGKTTIAVEAEKRLFDQGRLVYRLDGDALRQGLNTGLGFSEEDRFENIRRAAHVARLMQDAGLVVIASFISPLRSMRQAARTIARPGAFYEVYVKASVQACVERDPKGFYKKAMAGEIKDYTGIAQGYEEPLAPELVIDTERLSQEACVNLLVHQVSLWLENEVS